MHRAFQNSHWVISSFSAPCLTMSEGITFENEDDVRTGSKTALTPVRPNCGGTAYRYVGRGRKFGKCGIVYRVVKICFCSNKT